MRGSASVFSRRLLAWYDAHRRDLPWRVEVDAYRVLVSELMLQQTQAATVAPYFERFMARFPTIESLAEADEQEVLRLWQGLGYYARARHLQSAARRVVQQHAGEVPDDPESLRKLPGVGRYTAGAVASIAFGRRAAIVDGNVSRVLCRLDRIETDPRERETAELLWRRARELLPGQRVGDFNSALMELGATICTARAPRCGDCPVRRHCEAASAGLAERIPQARRSRPTPLNSRRTFCIEWRGRWLLERRPSNGRWGGMWQFVTVPAEKPVAARGLAKLLSFEVSRPRQIGVVTHALTHRRYRFEVYRCRARGDAAPAAGPKRRWLLLDELPQVPLSRPQHRIAMMLGEADPNGPDSA